jgi:hypothetical protein
MRSDALSRPRRRVAPLLMTLSLLAGGSLASCSSSTAADGDGEPTRPEPDAAEREACTSLQGLVDAIVNREALSAVSGLDQMEQALAASGNTTLESSGRDFFETISGTVPNPGDLTVEETAQVGDRVLAAAQPALQQLLDECAQLGLAIENLPTGEGRP